MKIFQSKKDDALLISHELIKSGHIHKFFPIDPNGIQRDHEKIPTVLPYLCETVNSLPKQLRRRTLKRIKRNPELFISDIIDALEESLKFS